MNFDKTPAYICLERKELKDISCVGYLVEHKKTKAKILLMETEDDNKVFNIGFRTPPTDSTGVAHIVEHTVLCGSEKYPMKDPFNELVKGSLNTFLNAMTYSDKTIYPVASCNDKDFHNIMDVYLDAVFHPNIYREEKIFRQEGWHYEMENEESPITYNGVVYNEMKGVFSSPEQQLDRLVGKSLFPDTTYGVESGGEPEHIPELTYEEYLDFHRAYYHPSNSYIYLYGNLDMEKELNDLEANYLSWYDYLEPTSNIERQKPFTKPSQLTDYYSIGEEEDDENRTYYSYNTVVENNLDNNLYVAFNILEYVLCQTAGAPVKTALVEAGLGEDASCSYDGGIYQPTFSITVKNAPANQEERFQKVLRETLEQIVREGFDFKLLAAAINYFEFRYREDDYGIYPKGLMYSLQCFDSWLYDADKPFIYLEKSEAFAYLKERMNQGYFEQLIQKYLLDNPFASFLCLEPKKGLTREMDEKTSEKLAKLKESLSPQEIKKIVEETKALNQYQTEPSPQEELEKIPLLEVSDINPDIRHIAHKELEIAGCKTLHFDMSTKKINYLRILFDVTDLKEYAPYLGLLMTMIGYVDSNHYSYSELSNEIDIQTGGITNTVGAVVRRGDCSVKEYFDFHAKFLYEKTESALEIIREMIKETTYQDEKRLREVIAETKARLKMKLNYSGHTTTAYRALSYKSESDRFDDMIRGVGAYEFYLDLEEHFEERKGQTFQILNELVRCCFVPERMMMGITCDKEGKDEFQKQVGEKLWFVYEKASEMKTKPVFVPDYSNKNEGFETAGKVQFVSRAGNFREAGVPYSGSFKVLRSVLSYDYLYNQIRIQGGAYGCMCGFSYDGSGYFTSYRDPNLGRTNEVYEGVVDYLEHFEISDRDMTKYIIGTISDMDTPLNARALGNMGMRRYLTGVSEEDLLKERKEVLSTTVEDIRNAKSAVQAILDAKQICVIGNEDKIKEERELFGTLRQLL